MCLLGACNNYFNTKVITIAIILVYDLTPSYYFPMQIFMLLCMLMLSLLLLHKHSNCQEVCFKAKRSLIIGGIGGMCLRISIH